MDFTNYFLPEQLNRNRKEPLYLQVRAVLRSYIDTPEGREIGYLPKEQELCKLFKVSRNTVSQAISLLAEENLVQRIKRRGTVLTSALDVYDPSLNNRQVGLVFPLGQYWSSAISSMEKAALAHGYSFEVYPYKWRDLKEERRAFERARKKCNGVILYPDGVSDDFDFIRSISLEKYPFVLFDLYHEGIDCNVVTVNNFLGAYLLTSSLLEKKRKRIAFFTLHNRLLSMNQRLSGYKKALSDKQIEFCEEMVFNAEEFTSDSSTPMQDKILKHIERCRPDAIFGTSHDFSMVALQALLKNGYKVPDDIMFAKFDSSPEDELINVCLNTAEQPEKELGENAIESLLKLIKDPERSARRVFVAPKIKIRF